MLEGHLTYSSLYEVDVQVVPQVARDNINFNFIGRARVQFQVVYDIWYNMSVIALALCGQRNVNISL